MSNTSPDRYRSESPEPVSGAAPEKASEQLRIYRDTPIEERNWRRDPGFQLLSAAEKHQELIEQALRDVQDLSLTFRHAISNDARQQHLRDLLAEIENELQKEQYERM